MTHSHTLCINGKHYTHYSKRWEVPEKLDLLRWLSDQNHPMKFYWHSQEEEVAAVGNVLSTKAPPLFDKGNESTARFWGGHAFFKNYPPKDELWNSFPREIFVLPELEITCCHGKIVAITNSIHAPCAETNIDQAPLTKNLISLTATHHSPSQKNWDQLIEASLKKMAQSPLEKVVFARRTTCKSETPLHPFEILAHLPYTASIRFAIQFEKGITFIGATPERLFYRRGDQIFTEAVAGTRRRGKSEEEDQKWEEELRKSPKENREFSFVKQSIVEGLSPLCLTLKNKKEDSVLKTPHVQHLHNTFAGQLKPGTSDATLLSALHPTAAMGGFPKSLALEHLLQHEPFERGWYAAPLGYCSEKESAFAVGIRSALVEKNRIHFFAGAGIVAGSSPKQEWEELEQKLSLWTAL